MDSVIRITMTVKTVLKSLTNRLYNTKMQTPNYLWFPLKSAICHKEWRIYGLCEVFPFGQK